MTRRETCVADKYEEQNISVYVPSLGPGLTAADG